MINYSFWFAEDLIAAGMLSAARLIIISPWSRTCLSPLAAWVE
jgi:hypothetical protein